MRKLLLSLLALMGALLSVSAQNAYQMGWQALHEARVDDAILHFKDAAGEPSTRERAQLSLALIYTEFSQEKEAREYFQAAFNGPADLYPELYAMWFSPGAVSGNGKKTPEQLKFLQTLEKDPRNKGRLEAAVWYNILMDYILSFDKKGSMPYFQKLKTIDDWQLAGPFDNVMNSGHAKDFGVVAQPGPSAQFTSKYGAKTGWFDPPLSSEDGYFLKDMYFLSSNSIVYAQTFLESPAQQDVLLKFGYSGSLKVWLNDSLVYDNPEHRTTEMDYYCFRWTMHKGFNRVLLQLGDFEEDHANFTMRLTDLQHNAITLPLKTAYQPYAKGVIRAESIPFFALAPLSEKAAAADNDPADFLYSLLLAKAHKRSGDLNAAEEILEGLYSKQPKNYFVLRELIDLYARSNEGTNQNKYYAIFEEAYPEDKDILSNKIDEYGEKDNLPQLKETIKTYLDKYGTPYDKMRFDITIAAEEGEKQELLSNIEKFYKAYPQDYNAMLSKYALEKNYYSNPKKANALLETFLKTRYDYSVVNELADNYTQKGELDKAIALLQREAELLPYSIESTRKILGLLARNANWSEAIGIAKNLLPNRPSDNDLLHDLALLHKYADDQETSLKYYQEALKYFPFSFETNEEVRDLKGQKKALELVPSTDPMAIIRDYEANYKPPKKHTYDIVYDLTSTVIYQTRSYARVRRYILKLNDENAIENWQYINLSPGAMMTLQIDEMQTIKKNGQRIDADRNGGEVVFTNLEVGDYIYVSFSEKQVAGGKSSFFFSEKIYLNSHFPAYKIEYNLLAENGLPVQYRLLNGEVPADTIRLDGFTQYRWAVTSPPDIKEEPNAIPFDDVANVLYVSLGYSWRDVVDWYSDLSTYQAAPDFTIKNIVAGLFNGKQLSEEEKARAIYDFVCKNIQYSSVDFRQSGHIPQKASRVYNSRLGDCKDVSTLYVSMARAAGLKANLVLISTADNGRSGLALPSLDFNHCIVKVHLPQGEKFLELTDPDLPYGHLYHYHQGAPILEIPTQDIPANIGLESLEVNPGFPSESHRDTRIRIGEDSKVTVERYSLKRGIRGVSMIKSHYYNDEKMRFDEVARSIATDHKSPVSLQNLEFELLEPLRDTVKYKYTYIVENDVMKLGSLRTFKIPFSDKLINMEIFKDDERVQDFYFLEYEDTDLYEEEVEVRLSGNFAFREVPENIQASFKKSTYSLECSKVDDQTLRIRRRYVVDRENVKPSEFKAFKEFMVKVNEGENTHVVFQ